MNTRLVTAAAVVACALLNAVPAQAIEINGGASWGGWDDRGNSLDVGIWGSGSTTRSYELYTTVFTFAGNVFDPGPGRQQVRASGTPIGFAPGTYSTGAFANGNVILGIGARMNGASTVVGNTFVKFDLGSDSFQAASSLGAADGRVSESTWGHAGDFSVWMNSYQPAGPSNLFVLTSNGTLQSGTGAGTNLVGGYGSGVSYDFAMRMFSIGTAGGAFQLFFDLTAMQDLYGGGPNGITTGWSNGPAQIGMIGSAFKVAMYSEDVGPTDRNGNTVTFGVGTSAPVPAPFSLGLVAVGLLGMGAIRRRAG
jgi:hypothetical protein